MSAAPFRLGLLLAGTMPPDLAARHGTVAETYRAMVALGGPLPDITDYAVHAGQLPNDPAAADAWLITGSAHGVYDPLPWLPGFEGFVRAVAASRRPLVGVCFGHQLIAQALGGRAEKAAAGWGLGVQRWRVTTPQPFMDPPAPRVLDLYASHQDQVTVPPPGAAVWLTSGFCPIAGMAIGPRILTVQGHPDFTAAFCRHLLDWRGPAAYGERAYASARATADNPTDTARVARWIHGFLGQGRP